MTDVGTFPAVAALVIFCLAILFTLLLVFKAVQLPIRLRGRKPFVINVKYYIAPVIAVLAMLACTSMSIRDVGRGLLGNSQIQPYGILILFMSMAYIAGSLDATGLFAWLALKFTTMSGGRGRVLFLFYFLLSSFITTFTSNDVCILTLTPIVCYFAKATGVDPMPFLFAEYAAANTFGALLYTGNPTNIIVADAYNMTFLGYSKYMTLPTFAAGIVCFAMLLLEFHSSIPASIPLPSLDASHMLRDKFGALVGSINMLACLGLLAAAPSLGWSMWAITLVCAGLHCIYNVWAFRTSLTHVRDSLAECWTCGCEVDGESGGGEDCGASKAQHAALPEPGTDAGKAAVAATTGAVSVPAAANGVKPASARSCGGCGCGSRCNGGRGGCGNNGCGGCTAAPIATAPDVPVGGPCCESVVQRAEGSSSSSSRREADIRAPVPAMVVMLSPAGESGPAACAASGTAAAAAADVEAALSTGAHARNAATNCDATGAAATEMAPSQEGELPVVMTVDSLRGKAPTFWSLVFDLPWEVVPFALGMFVLVEGLHVQGWLDVFGSGLGRGSTSLPAAVFIMGFLSIALANTINNQPMTILLTRVALDARFTAHVGHGNTHKAALFALVLGSNIGAVFTLIGALAGILWSNIMVSHGRTVSYAHFARVCCPVGFMTLVASLLVLWFEFAVFPHDD